MPEAQRRGLPADRPVRLAAIDGGRLGEPVFVRPDAVAAPPVDLSSLHAGLAAMHEAADEAATEQRIADLEQEASNLRAELRVAHAEIARLKGETAARVAEVERAAEQTLLAERRRTVANYRLPSILALEE